MGKKHNVKDNSQVKEAEYQEKDKSFYYTYYKQLLIIPIAMLLIAMILIGYQYATTGDFVNKGISLKGGTSFTISNDVADIASLNLDLFKEELQNKFAPIEIDVRELKEFTSRKAISIDIDVTDKDEINLFKDGLVELIPGLTNEEIEGNMRTTGSSLGDSFFNQIIKAIILAFVFMGIVVFFQFRVIVPSIAVILAAFSDIIVTLAVVNVMGMKLSTAGIAAFLMLIGYSVDTDILLSTRVLKGKVGTVYDRVISSMKTGMLMNVTTLVAVTIALFVSQSDVITQIMTILFIGLLVDIINTWIQNAGILRYYMEKRGAK